MFGGRVFVLGLLLGIARGLATVAITLVPIWFKYLSGNAEITSTDMLLVLAIAVTQLFIFAYDQFFRGRRERGERRDHQLKIPLKLANTMEELGREVATALDQAGKEPARRARLDAAVQRLLECMRHEARVLLGDMSGRYLQVSLLRFVDAQGESMEVAYRAEPDRAVGLRRRADHLLAGCAGRQREHLVVNDFRRGHPFPKEGIATKAAPYRSILFVPLIDAVQTDQYACYGVVSVDSSLPFHFWKRDEELVIVLQPYTALLKLMLRAISTPVLFVEERR
jgi:hypothetical protein